MTQISSKPRSTVRAIIMVGLMMTASVWAGTYEVEGDLEVTGNATIASNLVADTVSVGAWTNGSQSNPIYFRKSGYTNQLYVDSSDHLTFKAKSIHLAKQVLLEGLYGATNYMLSCNPIVGDNDYAEKTIEFSWSGGPSHDSTHITANIAGKLAVYARDHSSTNDPSPIEILQASGSSNEIPIANGDGTYSWGSNLLHVDPQGDISMGIYTNK